MQRGLVACYSLLGSFLFNNGVFPWTFGSAAYQQALTDHCLHLKDASRPRIPQQHREGKAWICLAVSVSPPVMAVEHTLCLILNNTCQGWFFLKPCIIALFLNKDTESCEGILRYCQLKILPRCVTVRLFNFIPKTNLRAMCFRYLP